MKKNKIIIFLILVLFVAGAGFSYYLYQRDLKPAAPSLYPSSLSSGSTATSKQEPQSQFTLPISNYKTGQTKKVFGQYITPATSPVQPEKFTGYHTGVDIEQEQNDVDVPVFAISDGTVRFAGNVNGYGGVIIIEFSYQNQTYTALYGHIRLLSAKASEGDKVTKGQQLAILGTGNSSETDGERKHLHFAIHKGSSIEYRGYVQNKSELSNWLDPNIIIN